MPFLSPLFMLRDMLNRLFTRILAKTCMLMYLFCIYSSMHKKALQMCVCVRFRCVCVRVRFRCVCVRFRCVCACASDVCAENFSHSARLLLQQSWASYMLALCLRAVLISSPDTWDWTRMHALAVMHRRTLCENVGRAKIKGDFLCYRYRYFTCGIDALYRHTLYRYIDPYRWIVTPQSWC